MGILIIIGIIIFCTLINEFNEQLISKDKTIQNLQQQLEDTEIIEQNLQQQLEDTEIIEQNLQQQLEDTERTKRRAVIQANILKKDNEKLNNDINGLNTKIKDLENIPSNKEKLALKKEIKQYEETIKQYEVTIKQYEATIKQKAAQNDKQNQSIRTYLKEINIEYKPKIRNLEDELFNEKKLNKDLENQLSDKEKLNTELKNEIGQYKLQITKVEILKKENEEYQDKTEDLKNQLSDKEKNIKKQKSQITKQKSQINKIKAELDTTKKDMKKQQLQHEQNILTLKKELQEEQLLDEEIKKRFCNMLNHAEQEIFIVSPWITEYVTKWVLPILKNATYRGVKIHIIYGLHYKNEDIQYQKELGNSSENKESRYAKSKKQIKQYQKELGNSLTVEEINTHIKACICDNKYYLMGSHNFLSYDGNYGNYKDTWHELCFYGQNAKKAQALKQKCLDV